MLRSLIPIAAIALVLPATAQVSAGGTPYSLRNDLSFADVPTVQSAPFDAEAVNAEDAQREAQHLLPAYGRVLEVGAGLYDAGKWTDLPNGDRLWRLRVGSTGAVATELYFNMYLPEGAFLFVYDEGGKNVLGAFNSYNNTADGSFTTGLIDGESSIVEYYEPQAVQGMGLLTVKSVGHAYRQAGSAMSDPCEVDVNCSEGADWHEQRDAVVRVGIVDAGINYWCSGSLVNNLAEDCKPYFLTAKHCGATTSASDFNLWKFYFNYQKTGCGSGASTQNHIVTGCTKRGDSNDGGGNSGSDFLLLEANDPTIPTAYTPFWAGWDANNTATAGGVGIHHPAGSQKKISTFTVTPSNTSWGGPFGTHWSITWAATANGHGVTEGGSSGSPIFNNAHRIIGTLTGGGSCCVVNDCGFGTGPNAPDAYGKVSYHWQSDPGPVSAHLKSWLDPNSTGLLTMDGSYDPCGTAIGIQENNAERVSIGLAPNPTNGTVIVSLPPEFAGDARMVVVDALGRTVLSRNFHGQTHQELDLSGEAAGVYSVQVRRDGTMLGETRLMVQ